jgi:hypothetical protein
LRFEVVEQFAVVSGHGASGGGSGHVEFDEVESGAGSNTEPRAFVEPKADMACKFFVVGGAGEEGQGWGRTSTENFMRRTTRASNHGANRWR